VALLFLRLLRDERLELQRQLSPHERRQVAAEVMISAGAVVMIVVKIPASAQFKRSR